MGRKKGRPIALDMGMSYCEGEGELDSEKRETVGRREVEYVIGNHQW
jgi:hypothetical protein